MLERDRIAAEVIQGFTYAVVHCPSRTKSSRDAACGVKAIGYHVPEHGDGRQ